MSRTLEITEGELLSSGSDIDPDLNAAFYAFEDSIKAEEEAQGSIAIFEVPTDPDGNPRPVTFRRTKLFTVPVGSMTLDDICDKVLREYVKPGESILIQILCRKAGESKTRLNRMQRLKRAMTVADTANAGATGDFAKILQMLSAERARDRQEMRDMFQQLTKPAVDPMQQGLAIAERISTLAASVAGGRAPGAAGPSSMMDKMVELMLTKMMKQMLDGENRAPPHEDASDKILPAIADLAKPLLLAHAKKQELDAAREQRMLLEARTPKQPAAPAAPPPTKEELKEMKLNALLKEAVPQLQEIGAKANADVEVVAGLALDQLPEDDNDLNDAFYQLLNSSPEKFVAKLALFDASVSAHAEWWVKFQVECLKAWDPDKTYTPA